MESGGFVKKKGSDPRPGRKGPGHDLSFPERQNFCESPAGKAGVYRKEIRWVWIDPGRAGAGAPL